MTVWRALRLLGFGRAAVEVVPVDGQGRMRADALAEALRGRRRRRRSCARRPGNVNTGAIDPLADIVAAAREHGAWVHVDGAFGLWAAASPALAGLVAGVGDADSWATDGHKWLNVPYDCGVVAVRDRDAHAAAMGMTRLLPRALGRRRALQLRLGPRGVAASARVRGLRGAAVAGPRRGGGAGRAVLRAGAAAGRPDGGGRRRRGPQRRDAEPGAAALRRRRRSDGRRHRAACRRTGRAGWAGRAGTARRRCASRSRTGRRPRPTSTAPPRRSSPRLVQVQPLAVRPEDRDQLDRPSTAPNQCGVQVLNSTASPGSIIRSSSPRQQPQPAVEHVDPVVALVHGQLLRRHVGAAR